MDAVEKQPASKTIKETDKERGKERGKEEKGEGKERDTWQLFQRLGGSITQR